MKIQCPHCREFFETDNQLTAEIEAKFNNKLQKSLQEERERAEKILQAEREKNAKETEMMVQAKVADKEKKLAEERKKFNEEKKEEQKRILAEARAKALEENAVSIREKDIQIKQMQDAVKKLEQRANQGSQQIQGEALEQIVEEELKAECGKYDDIKRVGKGTRGADIIQTVLTAREENCGTILWEIKNAKWQESWVAKLKADMEEAKANMAVLVVKDLPEKFGEIRNIEGGRVLAIKSHLVRFVASILRQQLINFFEQSTSMKFANEQVQSFYDYLTSGEFENRFKKMGEQYVELSRLHEKDKLATMQRWGEYEKSMQIMMTNMMSFSGEMRAISKGEIDIPLLGDGSNS